MILQQLALSLLWCSKFARENFGSVQLMTIVFILNVDNADYIMIIVFHSHTCQGSKTDMELTQNDGEIPTKVECQLQIIPGRAGKCRVER